jgi:hypothetical protein
MNQDRPNEQMRHMKDQRIDRETGAESPDHLPGDHLPNAPRGLPPIEIGGDRPPAPGPFWRLTSPSA